MKIRKNRSRKADSTVIATVILVSVTIILAFARARAFATYDGIGVLVKDSLVDVNTVFELMSEPIVVIWYKFETIIKLLRREAEVGINYMENFEYLADVIIKMRIQKGLPLPVRRLHPTSTLHPELKT